MPLEPPDEGRKAARHPHRSKVDDLLFSIESGGEDAGGQEPASPVAATVGVDADLGIVNVLREAERGSTLRIPSAPHLADQCRVPHVTVDLLEAPAHLVHLALEARERLELGAAEAAGEQLADPGAVVLLEPERGDVIGRHGAADRRRVHPHMRRAAVMRHMPAEVQVGSACSALAIEYNLAGFTNPLPSTSWVFSSSSSEKNGQASSRKRMGRSDMGIRRGMLGVMESGFGSVWNEKRQVERECVLQRW